MPVCNGSREKFSDLPEENLEVKLTAVQTVIKLAYIYWSPTASPLIKISLPPSLSLPPICIYNPRRGMKVIENLRRTFACCFSATSRTTTTSSTTPLITIKSRLSSTLTDLFNHQHNQDYDFDQQQQQQEEEDQDSLIDAASLRHYPPSPTPSHHHHHRRSTIVGTIYGRRRGHVTFCVQSDPSTPPPFLFELSVPTHLLAKEMNSGILRIALECHRLPHHHHPDPSSSSRRSTSSSWRAYCNGRKVGYAVRRKPSERDKSLLQTLKSMSAGAGVLFAGGGGGGGGDGGDHHQEGELLYMRACYERVVGSRDSVSYHLINPAGAGDENPAQELSVFLLRTG